MLQTRGWYQNPAKRKASYPKGNDQYVAELSSEVSKILEQALALSVEEQEALAESTQSQIQRQGRSQQIHRCVG